MSTWEERMSQRAHARMAASEQAEREARQAQYRDAVEAWTARMPALPGETRVLEGEHAGHLAHRCGGVTRCSCGEVFDPVCVAVIPGEVWECETCQARKIGEQE